MVQRAHWYTLAHLNLSLEKGGIFIPILEVGDHRRDKEVVQGLALNLGTRVLLISDAMPLHWGIFLKKQSEL